MKAKTTTPESVKIQLAFAYELGRIAKQKHMICMPAADKTLSQMFVGRQVGQQPDGEASTVDLGKAWLRGWTHENLANARAKFYE